MVIPFMYHPGMNEYDFGKHPFRAENVGDLRDHMQAHIDAGTIEEVAVEPAGDDILATVHSPGYVGRVKELERTSGHLSPDTWVAPGTVDAARAVVGGAVAAVDLALGGEDVVLSPGGFHHAGVDFGEGFCLFNDVAIAVRRALDSGLDRVMVIDTDAHQGNGTMDIFYPSSDVLFLSLHQHPRTLYPGRGFVNEIGSGEGRGYTVNVPMFPFSQDAQYREAFERVVRPLARQFEPELVIRNGGSDPHFDDQLTSLGMTMDGFREMGAAVRAISRDAGAPLVDLVISGYGSHAVPGWLQIWSGATGIDMTVPYEERPWEPPGAFTGEVLIGKDREMLEELAGILSPHWDGLK